MSWIYLTVSIILVKGWMRDPVGSPQKEMIEFVKDLGYASVTIDYRDAGSTEGWWAAMNDAACALEWVYANADVYGFDVDRMVAFGNYFGVIAVSNLALAEDINVFIDDLSNQIDAEGKPFQGVITFGGGHFGLSGPGLFFGSDLYGEMMVDFLFWEEEDILETS